MKKLLLTLLGLFLASIVFSQNNTLIDTTLRFKVNYEVSLDTARRIYNNIKVEKPHVKPEEQSYSTLNKEPELNKISPKISAHKISPLPTESLFKNYIRAGFGNYLTPYGELYTMSGRNTDHQYGVHLKHKSSQRGPVDKKNSGQGYNSADVFTRYKLSDKLHVGGRLYYQRDMVHYYGYPDSLEKVSADTIKQIYSTLDVGLNTAYQANSNLNFDMGVGYRSTSAKSAGKETDLKFYVLGKQTLGDNNLLLDISGSVSQYEDSIKYTRNYFKIKPYYQFLLSDFQLHFGINAVVQSDTLREKKGVHIYPFLDFIYTMSETSGWQVYGGVGGDMQRNTYQSFLGENLFLNNYLYLNNTNNVLNIYVGTRSKVLNGLVADAGIAYKSYRNFYYFTNSLSNQSKFDITYDEKEVKVFDVKLDLAYEMNKNLSLELKNVFHSYSNYTPDKMIHRPNYEMDLFARYKLQQDFFVTVNAFYLGGLHAFHPEKLAFTKLDGIFDVSLTSEYRLSKRASVYAEVNNILTKSYQRYLFYKSKGVNFLLGVTISF